MEGETKKSLPCLEGSMDMKFHPVHTAIAGRSNCYGLLGQDVDIPDILRYPNLQCPQCIGRFGTQVFNVIRSDWMRLGMCSGDISINLNPSMRALNICMQRKGNTRCARDYGSRTGS